MKIRYAEDYQAGDIFELGSYKVNQEEIIEFSRKYDPFRFILMKKPRRKRFSRESFPVDGSLV